MLSRSWPMLLALLSLFVGLAFAPSTPTLEDLSWMKGGFEGTLKLSDPSEIETDDSTPAELKMKIEGATILGGKFLEVDIKPNYLKDEETTHFTLAADPKDGKLRLWCYDPEDEDGDLIYEVEDTNFGADEDSLWWKDGDDGVSKLERTSDGIHYTYRTKEGETQEEASMSRVKE